MTPTSRASHTRFGLGVALAVSILSSCAVPQSQEINSVDAETIRTWLDAAEEFRVLDVRSVAEFVFVGHPEGAVNVPLMFWDSETGMTSNERFLEDVTARFDTDETIVVICRSGGRSARATRMLAEAGFTDVYDFADGFEGPFGEEGLRNVSGWRISGLPYDYAATPEQLYEPPPAPEPAPIPNR